MFHVAGRSSAANAALTLLGRRLDSEDTMEIQAYPGVLSHPPSLPTGAMVFFIPQVLAPGRVLVNTISCSVAFLGFFRAPHRLAPYAVV